MYVHIFLLNAYKFPIKNSQTYLYQYKKPNHSISIFTYIPHLHFQHEIESNICNLNIQFNVTTKNRNTLKTDL